MNQNDSCPIATTLDVIGGKWKVYILCVLMDGKCEQMKLNEKFQTLHKSSDSTTSAT